MTVLSDTTKVTWLVLLMDVFDLILNVLLFFFIHSSLFTIRFEELNTSFISCHGILPIIVMQEIELLIFVQELVTRFFLDFRHQIKQD